MAKIYPPSFLPSTWFMRLVLNTSIGVMVVIPNLLFFFIVIKFFYCYVIAKL